MANTFKNATAQKVDTTFVTVYDANAANLTATVVLVQHSATEQQEQSKSAVYSELEAQTEPQTQITD